MNNVNSNQVHQGLHQLFAAGRSLIMVQTYEEDRLGGLLEAVGKAYHRPLWRWQINQGLTNEEGQSMPDTTQPEQALAYLQRLDQPPVVWLKDLHHHYHPAVTRGLRDLYYAWRNKGGYAVISATTRAIPADLEREVGFLLLDMPSQQELAQEVSRWQDTSGITLPVDPGVVSATLKGLTLSEAHHALRRVQNLKPDDDKVLGVLQEEKRRLIQKTGTLEYIPNVPSIDKLGGLENLKDWLSKRRDLLVTTDEAMKEIVPKGILLMGVSGCGKSLCIKAISSAWRLPLYRIEMTRIFSGAHGSPELAFSEACHMMEQMAPAILWIDEIEMGLSAEGSTAADSTMSRIFAFFLTWMQEKPPGLFVAATANRIDLLPAEMIRKGRFDQVFFVDLPTTPEREAVFRIHIARRGYDPEKFTLEVFADATEGWSGAEIEQCVISAITAAKMANRELELKDLYASRKQIVPISQTMEEQVRHIRNWAYERAVRASAEA